MIELRVTHRRHAENDTLNICQEASYNVIAYHCSIPFLTRLAIWLDSYTWSRSYWDPEIIKKASDALRFSVYTSSTACRNIKNLNWNIKNLNHAHDSGYYILKWLADVIGYF